MAQPKTTGAALLILRFFLTVFLLQWSVEKLIMPSATIRIAQSFYGVSLPTEAAYGLGVAELVLALALLLGAFQIVSYGLSLIVHTITVIVSWKQLFDPYGFAKVGNHLWISTWPTWGAFRFLDAVAEAWQRRRAAGQRSAKRPPPVPPVPDKRSLKPGTIWPGSTPASSTESWSSTTVSPGTARLTGASLRSPGPLPGRQKTRRRRTAKPPGGARATMCRRPAS
jgi:uncharacterized membrane protein YphA (DoxX/SURF4 family)